MRPLLPLALAAWSAAAPLYLDSPAAPEVVMGEYIVARAAERTSVQTLGVATCVALALHDPEAKAGALAHFAPSAKVGPSFDRILRDLLKAGARADRLNAQLVGGWGNGPGGLDLGFRSTSPEIVAALKAALARRRVPIVREEVLAIPGAPGASALRNLALDLDTGALHDFAPTFPFPEVDRSAAQAEFARTGVMQPHPLTSGPSR